MVNPATATIAPNRAEDTATPGPLPPIEAHATLTGLSPHVPDAFGSAEPEPSQRGVS